MINLSKEDINILMNLISEKIVDMKSRQNEIDLNKFEKIILLSVKIENEWLKLN